MDGWHSIIYCSLEGIHVGFMINNSLHVLICCGNRSVDNHSHELSRQMGSASISIDSCVVL